MAAYAILTLLGYRVNLVVESLPNGSGISIDGHETNKSIRDEAIGSPSWISDLIPSPIPVSGVGSSRFVGPESVSIQTVPVIITIIGRIWITCRKQIKTVFRNVMVALCVILLRLK